MTKINYSSEFWDDLSRLTDFLILQNSNAALATYDIIMHGITLLKTHPEIGRLTPISDLRELIISRGNTGYIALYCYDELLDVVMVLNIWHQRAIGLIK